MPADTDLSALTTRLDELERQLRAPLFNYQVAAGAGIMPSKLAATLNSGQTAALISGNTNLEQDIQDILSGAATFDDLTISGQNALTFTHATAEIIPGATSLTFRNNADDASNLIIADSGACTFRAGLSGITSLAMGGALSGVTTLELSGALTSTAATDANSINTGSIITDGGVGIEKALWVGGLLNVAGAATIGTSLTLTAGNLELADDYAIAWGGVAQASISADVTGATDSIYINLTNVNRATFAPAGLTLAGTLTVNGAINSQTISSAASLTGTLAVAGVVTAAAQPRCLAFVSAAQSQTTSGSWQVVALDGESYDVGGLHDTVTNNSRITITSAGAYLVIAKITIDTNTTGIRVLAIYKGGSEQVRCDFVPSAGSVVSATISWIDSSGAATNYYEMAVYQDSGGSRVYSAGAQFCHLQVIKLW